MEQANSFSQNTELRQEQTLAPQQILSLEFLMAPVMELEEKVELELSSNPVLELDEKREEPSSGEADDPYADLPALPQTPDLRPDADESHMLDSNREDFEEHLDKIAETPEAWDAFSHDDAAGYLAAVEILRRGRGTAQLYFRFHCGGDFASGIPARPAPLRRCAAESCGRGGIHDRQSRRNRVI